jgi:hypothetical protein
MISAPGVIVPLFKLPPSGSKPGNLVMLNKSLPYNAILVCVIPIFFNMLVGRVYSILASRNFK